MLWLKLGWRNLWRNRRRSIIELISIGGAVFLAVAWSNLAVGSYAKMINDGVKLGSGHIGVYHKDYIDVRKTELTVPADSLVPAIAGIPGVTGVYARLRVPALVRSARENRAGLLLGLDIEAERGVNPLLADKNISAGELPSEESATDALVGADLARELDIETGNKFVVMLQGADGQVTSALLRVRGIMNTGIREFDAATVIVPRQRLAAIIGRPGAAHEIAVMLGSQDDIDRVLPAVQAVAERYDDAKAYTWREAMPELSSAVNLDYAGLQVIVIILYIIVGIGTVNTLLMSVMERTREFGVIRAVGISKAGIRKIVLAESLVLAGTGIAIGLALGVLAGLYTSTQGIDFSGFFSEQEVGGVLFEPVMYSAWDIAGMARLSIGMLVIAVIASLYPAYRALRIRPAEAIRKY